MKTLLTLSFSLFISYSFSQVSLADIALNHGQYPVGFEHFTSYDSSRSYKRTSDWNNQFIPRPIPVSIWYPATKATGQKLTTLDYMRILKEEEEWEHLPDELILNWFYYANTPQNQQHLTEQTSAYQNAEKRGGNFPVIIYAPSLHASSIENFGLCEFLASHGYIVISSQSRGTNSRFFEKTNLQAIETQGRDIQYLISKAQTFTGINSPQIATIGFSFGGISNILAFSQNKEIKAIISLDGSIKYQYEKIENTSFFDINAFNIPFMHLSQKDIPMEVMIADNMDTTLNQRFDFFDQLTYSSAYHFKYNDLTHAYFSTLGVLFQQRDKRQDKSDIEIMASYKWTSEYTLRFLNAYLLENATDKKWLNNNPVENGINPDIISKVAIKKANSIGTTFQDFNEMAAKDNYQNLEELYDKIIAEDKTFNIPEGQLNNLGLQLVFNPKTSESGIKVFLFATQLYPSSSNLFDSLGEAYLFLDDKKKALSSFQKSLKLDINNQNAEKRIRELLD